MRISQILIASCISAFAAGCASPAPSKRSPTTQPTVLQTQRDGRFVVRVTKLNGKNVLTVVSGNPDRAALAGAQMLADETVELKEGEHQDLTVDMYRPK